MLVEEEKEDETDDANGEQGTIPKKQTSAHLGKVLVDRRQTRKHKRRQQKAKRGANSQASANNASRHWHLTRFEQGGGESTANIADDAVGNACDWLAYLIKLWLVDVTGNIPINITL